MPAMDINLNGHPRKMGMLGLKVVWRGSMVAWVSAKPRAIEEPHRGAEQPRSNSYVQNALIKAFILPLLVDYLPWLKAG